MKCHRCKEFYKEHPLKKSTRDKARKLHILNDIFSMSPVQCAFDRKNVFNTDNWSCRTMDLLREIAEENRLYDRDDMSACSIGIVRIPEDDNIQQGYIVMTWYKNRGRTGQAWVMCDDDDPQPLTLKTAEKTIESYGRLEKFKEESQ